MIKQKGIRTKTYYCGKDKENNKPQYLEIDLFPFMNDDRTFNRRRKCKSKLTEPKQKNLNDKRAKRYFRLLLKSNFTSKDLHITLTYNNKNLPTSVEEADKEVRNYIRRIMRANKKAGLGEVKYIFVTEQGVRSKRIHHHLIISCDLDRDALENLWRRPKKKGEKQGESMGYANADRLRLDDNGLEALAEYLSKDPKGRKRWSPSRNLKKPEISTSDTKTSNKQFVQLVLLPEDCEKTRDFFEKRHPGYKCTSIEKRYNEVTGTWAIYAKMSRRI